MSSEKKRRRGARSKDGESNGTPKGSSRQPIGIIPDGSNWHELSTTIAGAAEISSEDRSPPSDMIKEFRSLADQTYKKETDKFDAWYAANASADDQFLERTARGGGATMSDKISSMVIMIQAHPLYRMSMLDDLLNLATKEKRVATMVGDSLRDLMINNLLPGDRKLVTFDSRPLRKYADGTVKLSPKVLMFWRFEELLKERYSKFLALLRMWLNDTLDNTKKFALHTSCSLLSSAPEQEESLLLMIVNKLGDPSKKAAASAGHQLRRVLESHPNMTTVVCREVQQLAHRPNLAPQSVYNCVIFLNQVTFVKGEMELPRMLVRTYFKLFEMAMIDLSPPPSKSKKGSKSSNKKGAAPTQTGALKSRLLSALLTGVNRAHPYLGTGGLGSDSDDHVDSLYRVVHKASSGASTQALLLLFNFVLGQSPDSSSQAASRFFRALYSRMSDHEMYVGKANTMFFNLVYRAIKADKDSRRKVAMVKRLLHYAMHVPGGAVGGGALFLVAAVMGAEGGAEGEGKSSIRDSMNEFSEGDFNAATRVPEAAFEKEGERGSGGDIGNVWEMGMMKVRRSVW